MTIEERKEKFVTLGKFLSQFDLDQNQKLQDLPHNDPHFERLDRQITTSVSHNGWFTRENIIFSLRQWSKALSRENLDKWLSPYSFNQRTPKTVGIVMAGNIPLVGFHDFIAVLIAGHRVLIKQSSSDRYLLPILADYLIDLAPEWKDYIDFLPETSTRAGKMENYDAIIATGSNNTARYFEYYFADKPSIIRKNRNSAAVLTGNESDEELSLLGEDIFRYYGLGCRNVSKFYVPEGYNFDRFFKAIYSWNPIMNSAKYANNYDYNKAVYLMSMFKLLENGFLMLKEDKSFSSPIATVFYETYTNLESLKEELSVRKEEIQCIVGNGITGKEVPFGKTQQPQLWDYADNVDTLDFLLKI